MSKRLILFIGIGLVWVLVACSISQLRPQRQARITSTPTRTPKPTFTATATPTHTLTPTLTPRPTNTPTNTPLPTDTPLPTNTPPPTLTPTNTATPRPTNTPTITPRPTRRPTARPTQTSPPQPTKPPPLPFNGAIVRGYPHCGGHAGVFGYVRHANGDPFAGVAVGVWSGLWDGDVAVSQADGKYDIPLTNVPYGKYHVAVVNLDTCDQRDGRPTAVNCQRRSNVVDITVTEHCEVNRVTEVEFRRQ